MSSTSKAVSYEVFSYLAARTRQEDEFLSALKTAAETAGIPEICISPEQASFMGILLGLIGAQQVVEVGTLAGYSAIVMARSLPSGGCVHTIELEAERVAFAREWVAQSDVAGKVEVHEGAGADTLAGFADESFDACFIDADKEGYPAYLEHCMRLLRPGGLVMADNAFAFGQLLDPEESDPDVKSIREFNNLVAAREDLDAIIVRGVSPWRDEEIIARGVTAS